MTVYSGNASANQLEWNGTANVSTGIANNILDGNASTTFTTNGMAMMVVDLGDEYTISDVRIKMGTAFPNEPRAYQGTSLYCTTSIPEEIDLTNIAQLVLTEDTGRVNVRNLYTLRGDTVCGGTVYPLKSFLSTTYPIRLQKQQGLQTWHLLLQRWQQPHTAKYMVWIIITGLKTMQQTATQALIICRITQEEPTQQTPNVL